MLRLAVFVIAILLSVNAKAQDNLEFLLSKVDLSTSRFRVVGQYESKLSGKVCGHYYAENLDTQWKEILTDYLKALKGEKFEHPSMQYASEADISKFSVAGIPFADVWMNKVPLTSQNMFGDDMEAITGRCLAYIPDALRESFMFTDAKNGAFETTYGYYCSEMETSQKTNVRYDQDCENRKNMAYVNCMRGVDSSFNKATHIQGCMNIANNFERVSCKPITSTYNVTTCRGKGFIVGKNHKSNPMIIVPFEPVNGQASVSPKTGVMTYREIVDDLYNKYGPATVSFRRRNTKSDSCSGLYDIHEYAKIKMEKAQCEKNNNCGNYTVFMSDTYYWLAKPWVLRVQVIFPNGQGYITDDEYPVYVSTMYINWDSFEEQDTYAKSKE